MTEQDSWAEEPEGAPPKPPVRDAISMLQSIPLKALVQVTLDLLG